MPYNDWQEERSTDTRSRNPNHQHNDDKGGRRQHDIHFLVSIIQLMGE